MLHKLWEQSARIIYSSEAVGVTPGRQRQVTSGEWSVKDAYDLDGQKWQRGTGESRHSEEGGCRDGGGNGGRLTLHIAGTNAELEGRTQLTHAMHLANTIFV